jgi:predicted RNA binding protein YcfA (HicA-like mRNA interferase family)
MPKLPVLSGIEIVKALKKIGYEPDHQTGSHIILRQNIEPHRRVTVPNHPEVSKKTLRAIIRETGLTRESFDELVN